MKHAWLLLLASLMAAQSGSFTLGTTSIVVGPTAGNGSVILIAPSPGAAWNVASRASWLHLSGATSGSGSVLVPFSYDANPNPNPRTGTLTIAGQTLAVTQAGSRFVAVTALTTLVSAGLNLPYGVAVDSAGNVYVADTGNNAVEEWNPASQQLTTLVATGLNGPHGVAVDTLGNVYIADAFNNAIKQWSPATRQVTTLVSTGLNFPLGVAVDAQFNVYIADYGNNAIEVWSPSSGFATLVGSGLSNPAGVAVDGLGNVYIADFRNNAIEQWNAAAQQLVPLLSQGLSFPNSVALDGQGNVYLVDGNDNALLEWSAANRVAAALAPSGINGTFGVASDPQGNLYIANTTVGAIQKFSSAYLQMSAGSPHEGPHAGSDSFAFQVLPATAPITATSNQPWLTVTGVTGGVINYAFQANTSASARVAQIDVLGQIVTVTQNGDRSATVTKSAGDGQTTGIGQAFPTNLQVNVTDANSNPLQGASVTFSVTSGVSGAGAGFVAQPSMPILTDQNGNATAPVLTANSVAGQFKVTARVNGLTAVFTLSNSGHALQVASITVGSAAGAASVELISNGGWTAVSNSPWLQLSSGSTRGSGNSLIQFTYSANSNAAAQTGTLTIAGTTFTVNQAGTSYVPVRPMSPLVTSGLNGPQGMAVDSQGNVYIADTANNAVRMWNAGTQQVTTLVSSGLNAPKGLAVDAQWNVYIADSGNNAIKKWNAVTRQVTMLVSSGLSNPSSVALDQQGNVYIADTSHNAIEQWNPVTSQFTVLVSSGLNAPAGVAVDALGNVYTADTGNNAIERWNAVSGLVTLVSAGLSLPSGVTVDGQGNVYFTDTGNNAIKMCNPASQQTTTLVSSGLNGPSGIAWSGQTNLYVADTNNGDIKSITLAYLLLSSSSKNEGLQSGADSISALVLPTSVPLTASSDQPWLTIAGTAGGVIGFAFQMNPTVSSRTAHINVFGQTVTVTQSGDIPSNITKSGGDNQVTPLGQVYPFALLATVADASGIPIQGAPVTFSVQPGSSGATATFSPTPPMPILTDQDGNALAPPLTANNIAGTFSITATVNGISISFSLTNVSYSLGASSAVVASTAGTASVILIANGPWTAFSNADWMTVSSSTTTGFGPALIQYSYAPNLSPTPQIGTLNISGLTFTVTQAGANFVPAVSVTTLPVPRLKGPRGLALDSQGNIYVADTGNNVVKEWNATTQQTSTLVSSGLKAPAGVAVDTFGNVYIADTGDNAIKEWSVSSGQVTTLVSSAKLQTPGGVSLASSGTLYFTSAGLNSLMEYISGTGATSRLVSTGLNAPQGVTATLTSSIVFADTGNNAIKVFSAVNKSVSILPNSGLNAPAGVAVDGLGNIFIADTGNSAIKLWNVGTPDLATLVATGLNNPGGIALDGHGNLYIADTNNNAIEQATFVFLSLSATSFNESAAAGSGSVTAQVLPATTPLSASSDQSWLTITGIAGGVISFTFAANTSTSSRTAHITVFDQPVTVVQAADVPAMIAKTAGDGQPTSVGLLFPTALQVRIRDAAGNPISGAPVTFTAQPGSGGSSGTFSSTPPIPVLTTSGGYATAPALTANSIAGKFTVVASIGNLSTTFTLTITKH